MADLTPEIVDSVVAACQAGAEETAEAFGRALDASIKLSVGEPGTLDLAALPDDLTAELTGPGLVVTLTIGDVGVVVVLPEATGLVPSWCAAPDPTGQSKLMTLAQELGMLVVPEDFMPDDFQASRVDDLAEALRCCQAGRGGAAAMVPLNLDAGERRGIARVVWPITKTPAEKVAEKPAVAAATPSATPAATEPEPATASSIAVRSRNATSLDDLPDYTHSLLRVEVPIVVTLAQKRQAMGRIVELGPGSIIQFEKSCEEMLELRVGDHPVAMGEAVKVGDKFGLRITSITLPDERFFPLRAQTSQAG